MNKYIRYIVQMRNGGFMKQEWDGSLERVKLESVDNPLDADLIKEKSHADRIINDTLSGSANLLVTYTEENPPLKVIEIEVTVKFNE